MGAGSGGVASAGSSSGDDEDSERSAGRSLLRSSVDFFRKILPKRLKLLRMNLEVLNLIPRSAEASDNFYPSFSTRFISSFLVYVMKSTHTS